MWNILFVLIQYVLAKAAGILAKFRPLKEFEISDIEKNFFDPNFFAQSSIGVLKKAFEVFFGTTTRSIFTTSMTATAWS